MSNAPTDATSNTTGNIGTEDVKAYEAMLFREHGLDCHLLASVLERVKKDNNPQSAISCIEELKKVFDISTTDGAYGVASAFLYSELQLIVALMKTHDSKLKQGIYSGLFNSAVAWSSVNPGNLADFGYYLVHELGIEAAKEASRAFAAKDWEAVDKVMRALDDMYKTV
ncbi:MAG: hypothetical protein CL504_09610 [Actinobacteria bacterium]|nr:hypothetical protein [Actinomycetota bacterium]|tara:strand:- start:973 stop:1479 length:507 start_codon:yes stop_codon:yes gene_type:complete